MSSEIDKTKLRAGGGSSEMIQPNYDVLVSKNELSDTIRSLNNKIDESQRVTSVDAQSMQNAVKVLSDRVDEIYKVFQREGIIIKPGGHIHIR